MNDYLNKENYIMMSYTDEWYRTHNNNIIMKQYKEYVGKKCAVLGCNSGYQCFLVGELNNVNEVIGYDINNSALSFGENNYRNNFPDIVKNKVKLKYSNLLNIDSINEYFDSIITFHTLEHIYPEDLNGVISEKYRILKSDGYIIISIPHDHEFDTPHQHMSFFTVETLKELFESNNFKTIECFKDDRWSAACITGLFKKYR